MEYATTSQMNELNCTSYYHISRMSDEEKESIINFKEFPYFNKSQVDKYLWDLHFVLWEGKKGTLLSGKEWNGNEYTKKNGKKYLPIYSGSDGEIIGFIKK